MKILSVIIIASFLIYGCDKKNYKQLIGDTCQSVKQFREKNKESEWGKSIPKKYWVGKLKKLNPVVVYTRNTNIAIVLKKFKNDEEGLYIFPWYSSIIPISNDEWKFEQIEENIYRYKRIRKNP